VVGDGISPEFAGIYRMAGGRVPVSELRVASETFPVNTYRPNTVAAPASYPDSTLIKGSGAEVDMIQGGQRRWVPDPDTFTAMGLNWGNVRTISDAEFNAIPQGAAFPNIPKTGATSVVNQPPPVINPPSPSVSNVPPTTPISPAPAPVVASPVVVPANDGSGNFIRVSDGSTVPASDVYQNPATGQYQATVGASSGITSWLTQSSVWSAVPNWTLLAAGVGVLLLTGGKGRR